MSIDRRRLVGRHNPVLRAFDARSPLSVGNGELAFTVDCTGLQTFRSDYDAGTPLCTQSQWGWHSFPGDKPAGELQPQLFNAGGRTVPYFTSAAGQEPLFDRLRRNPHRLNLACIGFRLVRPGRESAQPPEFQEICQELNLWTGCVESRWRLWGVEAVVRTTCHPHRDAIAVEVLSPLCAAGCLSIEVSFPYGSSEMGASDWSSPERHRSDALPVQGGMCIRRTLDSTRYTCTVFPGTDARAERAGEHQFQVVPGRESGAVSAVFEFANGETAPNPLSAGEVAAASERWWAEFWTDGGCAELGGSRDPRAPELERRVVLSQYLTAIQCAGSLPPQETGLTCNSWYGKFHLEMHYWHAAHLAPWGRSALLERSLGWYESILPSARQKARWQGYNGARWPKMTEPDGADSPSHIGPLLVWQQPHPIMLAELVYRAQPSVLVLKRFADVVFETAEFMASFVRQEEKTRRFVLGPPLIPAQENHAPETTLNPTFELEYWDFGLRMANEWRRRLGLAREQRWSSIAEGLAELPMAEGVYLAHERCPDTYGAFADDHPSMLAALGVLPGRKADPAVMNRTYDRVLRSWRFPGTWGWDFPMMAMTAARLGRADDALAALLMDTPKNTWLPNGHNPQLPRADLPVYLPSNGGLLLAVALMAAGWDGAPKGLRAPGFPADGSWLVEVEGIQPLP